ncbi:MAG: FAD-binding oxidoreductase, partial [Caldilineaceae bacterium]|nr:FAD-binding oxidoreductase [Caldilineaceae bacterium]
MNPELLAELAALIPADRLSTTQAQRDLHAKDQSSHAAHLPDVVIWPTSTAEVSAVLAIAHAHGIPVTPWGAGTSLEGNTIPLGGGIVLNFQRMDQILKVHEQDFQVTVQPGIFYKDMNKILARVGLFFAPDPGANASIGGMLANNAAGSRTVKYGATRDNVLALEVVLADGTVIRTGNRSVKQSAGYDLTHLFVGSEGTLGVITQATLKLAPLPEHFSAATAAFPDVKAAAQAVFDIIGAGLGPAALELMDVDAMRILNTEPEFDFPLLPHLFMEFIGPSEASLEEILALAGEVCRERGAVTVNVGMGRAARNQLWEGR